MEKVPLYLSVEIGKEAEEHEGVSAHDVNEDFRVVAAVEQDLGRVDEHNTKLDHLN